MPVQSRSTRAFEPCLPAALVGGKAILIGGGQYRVAAQQLCCLSCGERWTAEGEAAMTPACPRCRGSDVRTCWGPDDRCCRPGGGHAGSDCGSSQGAGSGRDCRGGRDPGGGHRACGGQEGRGAAPPPVSEPTSIVT